MKKVVLMYHDIVTRDDKSSGFQNTNAFLYKVEETTFEEQVKALQGKDVVFTFDDGGVSFYTKAAQILEKYGFRGIFFISTEYIGTAGFLSVVQIKELAERGHVIGSHSHTHPPLFTNLSPEQIEREWKLSFKILAEIIGEKEIPVSIPNGYASKMIIDEAIQQGATDIYTSQPTTRIKLYENHELIGRYVVSSSMTTQDVLKIIASERIRFIMSVKWHFLNMVKRVLGSSYDKLKEIIFG